MKGSFPVDARSCCSSAISPGILAKISRYGTAFWDQTLRRLTLVLQNNGELVDCGRQVPPALERCLGEGDQRLLVRACQKEYRQGFVVAARLVEQPAETRP